MIYNFKNYKSGILKKQDAFLFILIFILFFLFLDLKSSISQTAGYKSGLLKNDNSFSKLELENSVLKDTSKNSAVKFEMKKSPWKAVLFSAVVPGLGQLYNETYWKVPVIALLGGYFGYEIFHYNNKFRDYRELYARTQTPENPNGDDIYRQYREFYRNQRDQFIFYFGIFYLVNLVDAYVDAHIYDFNVSDKVQLNLDNNSGLNVNLKINF